MSIFNGVIHKDIGNLNVAEEYANKALSTFLINNNDLNDPFISKLYQLLGHIYSLNGNIPSALDMYKKSIDIIRELYKTNPNTFSINLVSELGNLSYNHSLLGNYELAIEELHEAQEIITVLFNKYPLQYSEFYARINHDYAYQLKQAFKYKQAAEVIKKSITAYDILMESESERFKFQLAGSYNLLGCIYLGDNQNIHAKDALVLALNMRQELAQKYGDRYKDKVAQTLNNIALLNCNTYKFEESERQYHEVINIYEYLSKNNNQEHDCDIAMAYLNLAVLCKKQRQYDKAIKYGTMSIKIFKTILNSKLRDRNRVLSLLSQALDIISVVYFNKDDNNNCLIAVNESIELCEIISKENPKVYEIQLSCVYNELAWIKYKMREFEYSEPIAKRSVDIAKKYNFKKNIVMSLDTLACIHRELGKTEMANKEFLECIDLCNELHDTNEQHYDAILAHEYIELVKNFKKNEQSHSDILLNKAKILLNGLDENHKIEFKEYFDDLKRIQCKQ